MTTHAQDKSKSQEEITMEKTIFEAMGGTYRQVGDKEFIEIRDKSYNGTTK